MSRIYSSKTEHKQLRKKFDALRHTSHGPASTVLHIHIHHNCLSHQKPRFEIIATCISHLQQRLHLKCEGNFQIRFEAQVVPAPLLLCGPFSLSPSCSFPWFQSTTTLAHPKSFTFSVFLGQSSALLSLSSLWPPSLQWIKLTFSC